MAHAQITQTSSTSRQPTRVRTPRRAALTSHRPLRTRGHTTGLGGHVIGGIDGQGIRDDGYCTGVPNCRYDCAPYTHTRCPTRAGPTPSTHFVDHTRTVTVRDHPRERHRRTQPPSPFVGVAGI
ncbi:MAG: hypothetical protein WCG47_15620, partial [Dermatophilaceae bacterium]